MRRGVLLSLVRMYRPFIGDTQTLIDEVCADEGIAVLTWPHENLDGYTYYADKPYICVNAYHSPQRKRWSIGHEFGHYFLRHPRPCPPHYEREAHEFAECFFMPDCLMRDFVERGFTPWAIASQIGLSLKAVKIKLVKMGELEEGAV